MTVYVYALLLLFVMVLIIRALKLTLCFAPLKIKMLTNVTIIILFMRYITLLLFIFLNNILFLYLFKAFFFFYIMCIPIISMIVVYILIRNDRIRFNLIVAASFLIFFVYMFLIIKFPVEIIITQDYIYSMRFLSSELVFIFYMAANALVLLPSVKIAKKNVVGGRLIITAVIITLLETAASFAGIKLLPECILGESAWLILLNYSLSRLKSRG